MLRIALVPNLIRGIVAPDSQEMDTVPGYSDIRLISTYHALWPLGKIR
jgi:hypothetical protein